jgi:hypothetical protein
MTKNQQYLVVGGLGVAGLVFWWWWSSQQSAATQQITAQPPVPPSTIPPTTGPVNTLVSSGNESIQPVGTSTNSSGQDITQLNALLAWSDNTQNPTLYVAMINALTPAQLASLYNILTTDWDVPGASPTAAQTAFWNSLVAQYPFLQTAGKGCTNFACT